VPLVPYGTGTGLEGGVVALEGGVSVHMSKHFDAPPLVRESDFNADVQAGITRLTLNDHLKASGLFFPIDPGADASGEFHDQGDYVRKYYY
jgi:D-lactate dehydrogenase (cytochrome)